MKYFALPLLGLFIVACSTSEGTTGAQASNIDTAPAPAACTDATRPEVWHRMTTDAIRPPRYGAGLDFSGGPGWPGLQRTSIESTLCAGASRDAADESPTAAWGDAGEVLMTFDPLRGTASFVQFNAGYEGRVSFHSRAGSRFGEHSYELGVGTPLLRDGQPFELLWGETDKIAEQATELHDALVATFAPELPADDVNCVANQHCFARKIQTTDGGRDGNFGSRTVHLYFVVDQPDAPTLSGVPSYIYMLPNAPSLLPSASPPASTSEGRAL